MFILLHLCGTYSEFLTSTDITFSPVSGLLKNFSLVLSTRGRKRADLKTIISQGADEDLAHLQRSLDTFFKDLQSLTFMIDAPAHYSPEQVESFRRWLGSAGFNEHPVGDKVMMNVAESKLDQLRRVLSLELARRDGSPRMPSPSSTITNLSPSPPLSLAEPSKERSISDSVLPHSFDYAQRDLDSSVNMVPIGAAPLTRNRSQSQNAVQTVLLSASNSLTSSNSGSCSDGSGLQIDVRPEMVGGAAQGGLNSGHSSVSSRGRKVIARFPPRKNVMDLGLDRAESPAGASPYAGSPRFFADDVQSGRSTPNALQYNSQADNDEVYPTLGAGLGALALNRQVSSDSHGSLTGSSTYLETVQETQHTECAVPPTGMMVSGLDGDEDDNMSNASTLLDEDDHFDPDTDAPTSAFEPAADACFGDDSPGIMMTDSAQGQLVQDSSTQSASPHASPTSNRVTRSRRSRSVNDAVDILGASSAAPARQARGARGRSRSALTEKQPQELVPPARITRSASQRGVVAIDHSSKEHEPEEGQELEKCGGLVDTGTTSSDAPTAEEEGEEPEATPAEHSGDASALDIQHQMYVQDSETSIPLGRVHQGPGSTRYRDRSPSLDSLADAGPMVRDSAGNLRTLETVAEGSPTIPPFGVADMKGGSHRSSMGSTVSETRANKVKTMRNNLNPPVAAHMHTANTVGPAHFFRPTLHPGQQTPKCASGSRGSSSDPAKFNTPQGDAGPTLSGNGDSDWGTSEGAPDYVMMQMRARMEGLKERYAGTYSQPGLFRAHSTGYIEMRSDRTSSGSNISASSQNSNGFFTSRGAPRDSAGGSSQGGEHSGDVAVSPAFPPLTTGLLRSVSHAGKLEDATLSPSNSQNDHSSELSREHGSGGGIAMGGAGSLLGDSPQSYNALSGVTSFGATFPQSSQKQTGPRPAHASSEDGASSSYSPSLAELQKLRQQPGSSGLGGGAGSAFGVPPMSVSSNMDEVEPQGAIVDNLQSVHSLTSGNMHMLVGGGAGGVSGGDMNFGSKSALNPVAEAKRAYQEQLGDTNSQGFRSIVTANEGVIPGTGDMHSAATGADSFVDLDDTHHNQFLARLQAQSPTSRRERRVRSSAAKWRRQSIGFSQKHQTARLCRPGRIPISAAAGDGGEEHAMDGDREEGEIPPSLEESAEEVDEGQSPTVPTMGDYDDSFSPAVRCKSQSSTGIKVKKTRGRGRISVCGILPMSPDGDGTTAINSAISGSGSGGGEGLDDSRMHEASMTELEGDDVANIQAASEPMDALDSSTHNQDNFIITMQHDFQSHDSHIHPEVPGLHARSFRAHVVGGTYQQCFDGSTPVVAPPQGSSKRVTGVVLTQYDSLELRLFFPQLNEHKVVDLGQGWKWMRASPDGYLAFHQEIVPRKRGVKSNEAIPVCYYLPRHPNDWAEDCEENLAYHDDSTAISLRNPHVDLQRQEMGSNSSLAAELCDFGEGSGTAGVGSQHSSSSSLGHVGMPISRAVSPHVGGHGAAAGGRVTQQSPHQTSPAPSWGIGFVPPPGSHPPISGSGGKVSETDIASAALQGSGGSSHAFGSGGGLKHQVSWAGGSTPLSRASSHHHNSLAELQSPYMSQNFLISSKDTPGYGAENPDLRQHMHAGYTEEGEGMDHSDLAADLDVRMVLYSDKADWNDASMIAYVLQFLVDSGPGAGSAVRRTRNKKAEQEDAMNYRLVSRAWALASYRLLARQLAHSESSPVFPWPRWAKFVSKFSWGRFLSSGACKQVYCVQNQGNSGILEAVSVMNVLDLEARDMGQAVTKELEISLVCSSLAALRVCPNLVKVFSLFRSDCPVPPGLWNSSSTTPPMPNPTFGEARSSSRSGGAVVPPSRQNMDLGCYQYIRMEYCSGGDLEDFVRDHRMLSVPAVRQMLFQMCFGLYCCRDQLALRHFDIKLLNFMVAQGSSLLPAEVAASTARRAHSPFESYASMADQKNVVEMRIGFGRQVYCLPLLANGKELVKIADFGTSVVGVGGLGDPITVQQFTTLENTPPEFLLLGSVARQGFSADTFPLGLCFLHLLTGYEPYEVLLQDVFCPPYLIKKLQAIWTPDSIEDPYYVVREAVESSVLDEPDMKGDARDAGYEGAVLAHTLYRYLVLFSALQDDDVDIDSPAWTAVKDALVPPDGVVGAGERDGGGIGQNQRRIKRKQRNNGEISKARMACTRQYGIDRAQWSLHEGTHPMMKAVRERLKSLGRGAFKLLHRLVHFDPSRRCTMFEALISPVFAPLVDKSLSSEQITALTSNHGGSPCPRSASPRSFTQRSSSSRGLQHGVAFMHYYKNANDGGIDSLNVV